ncbi:PIG-X [Vararia minispora EC-137]|uniref:PIG-X n=1 Tax=Vararia minispora EC-137 TaxID=1314806 RepID=A0ACB8QZ67_9AGAM|nr:PIG-X [Vararia minispora EC-137]
MSSQVISWHLDPPYGAHPKSITRIHLAAPCPADCTLHLQHILPPDLFVDPYELELYADAYTYSLSNPRVELEKPVFAVPNEPLTLRVNIRDACARETLEVEVPLHVRYGRLRDEQTRADEPVVQVRPPDAFWTCASHDAPAADAYAGSLVDLPHPSGLLEASPDVRPLSIRIPVGDIRHLVFVESGTVLAVLGAFAWVGWRVIRAARRLAGAQRARGKDKNE